VAPGEIWQGRRDALIIATTSHDDEALRKLAGPSGDALDLAEVLEDPAVADFDVETVLNASSSTAAERIESFFGEPRRPEDTVLLYFTGHGLKDDDGRLYFAMTNTRRDRLRSTAISATFVQETLESTRARTQIVILDCCFSGAFGRTMGAKGDERLGVQEQIGGRGRILLTSSDALQLSFEAPTAQRRTRSIFTRAIVDGLRTGQADTDGDGWISVDDLYDFVDRRVAEAQPSQRPRKWALDVQGDIVLARAPVAPVAPVAEKPQPDLDPKTEAVPSRHTAPVVVLRARSPIPPRLHKPIALVSALALFAVATLALRSILDSPEQHTGTVIDNHLTTSAVTTPTTAVTPTTVDTAIPRHFVSKEDVPVGRFSTSVFRPVAKLSFEAGWRVLETEGTDGVDFYWSAIGSGSPVTLLKPIGVLDPASTTRARQALPPDIGAWLAGHARLQVTRDELEGDHRVIDFSVRPGTGYTVPRIRSAAVALFALRDDGTRSFSVIEGNTNRLRIYYVGAQPAVAAIEAPNGSYATFLPIAERLLATLRFTP